VHRATLHHDRALCSTAAPVVVHFAVLQHCRFSHLMASSVPLVLGRQDQENRSSHIQHKQSMASDSTAGVLVVAELLDTQ
jgi:hypothetical protein